MEIQEVKTTISVIETAEKNIENWNKLRGRELSIIPTDSEYYKEFKLWAKEKGVYYDGDKEKSPMYINGEVDEVLDLLIKNQEDFIRPHKEKLLFIFEK